MTAQCHALAEASPRATELSHDCTGIVRGITLFVGPCSLRLTAVGRQLTAPASTLERY